MNVGDIVLVPNMPNDGLFTLCRVTGDYDFRIAPGFDDFGDIRDVEVRSPHGVANEHDLVEAPLRRSLRCRSRLWSVTPRADCIDKLLEVAGSRDLTKGSTPGGSAESIVDEACVEPIDVMARRLAEALPTKPQGGAKIS